MIRKRKAIRCEECRSFQTKNHFTMWLHLYKPDIYLCKKCTVKITAYKLGMVMKAK